MEKSKKLPRNIRVSVGTAMVINLLKGRLDAAPTTAYLMTYRQGKCLANCGFCPQARKSRGRADMLSRVSWPVFSTADVLDGLQKTVKDDRIKRVCIQALNYPDVFTHLLAIVNAICQRGNIPISVSCQPLKGENLRRLAEAGVDRIGVPLDATTEEIFDSVKGARADGPYDWRGQFEVLKEAVNVFGKGKVSTHLIVGLGETEKEMAETIQRCVDMGVLPALFAFTPISGTALENEAQPPVESYRRIQIARYLIVHGIARCEDMRFNEEGDIGGFGVGKQILSQIARRSEVFRTSGCPDCNRPFYNEKPSGPMYNYPEDLTAEEIAAIQRQLGIDGE